MNINIKMPKLKFGKIKMNTVEDLENVNIDYEKMQRENLKQKRNSPYETTNYKTVKEFFSKHIVPIIENHEVDFCSSYFAKSSYDL